jgi:hypothetical protein
VRGKLLKSEQLHGFARSSWAGYSVFEEAFLPLGTRLGRRLGAFSLAAQLCMSLVPMCGKTLVIQICHIR